MAGPGVEVVVKNSHNFLFMLYLCWPGGEFLRVFCFVIFKAEKELLLGDFFLDGIVIQVRGDDLNGR